MKTKMIYWIAVLIVISSNISTAQIPSGYYDSAQGKTGYTLKTALHNIIKGHTDIGYKGLWSAYRYTDVDKYYENDGTILDMYSENPSGSDPYNYTPGNNQCGTYSNEGSCYNREHSFPKSWFNKDTPMHNDLFHVYPTDGKVNGNRGNFPYGETNNPTKTSQNGSKVGNCSFPGYSGTVFEPIDEFKGDFARSYFYMATRYQDKISSWNSAMLNGTSNQCFTTWALNLLIKWHKQDPVSQKEIDRNNIVYTKYQHNRNPYIDHPEWVECVFKNNCSTDPYLTITKSTINGFTYEQNSGPSDAKSFKLTGQNLDGTNVIASAPANYEISKDNTTFSNQLTFAAYNGSEKTIYVHLKAGLSAGTYNNENITISGGGATTNLTVTLSGSVTVPVPGLTASQNTLSNFFYVINSGPSASKMFKLKGKNLTGSDVTLTAPTNYEISEDDATFTNQITFAAYDGTEKTIYVRLKAGLSVATYNGVTITISGGGATNISVALNGEVEGITLTSNKTELTGFTYREDNGPSMSQNFSLTGKNLTGNVTITAPEHFEISKDDATFSNSIVLNNFDGSSTKIYVKLKAGYSAGNYSGENITISGGGATTISVSVTGKITEAPVFCDDFESDLTNWTVTNSSNPNAEIKISNTFSGAESTTKSALFDAPGGHSSIQYDTSSIEKTFINSKNLSIHFWYYFEDYRGGEIIVYLDDAKKYSIYTEGSGGNLKITKSTDDKWAELTVDLTAETSTAGNYTIKIEGKVKTAKFWKDRVAIDQLCVLGKKIPTGPTFICNPTSISNLSYVIGNGPSSSKLFQLRGYNLDNSDVKLTAPTNYEISEDNTTFTNQITLTAYDGSKKTLYARLKTGLSVAEYNNENITISGGGATNATVTLSGKVEAITLTSNKTELTGFTYREDNGPSMSQNFSLTGKNLTGDVTITAPVHFEISKDNATFTQSIVLNNYDGNNTTIHVRLKSGLTQADYNNENLTISGGSATNATVTLSGTVAAPTPVLTVSPSALTDFSYIINSGPSNSKSFKLSGKHLDNSNVTITAPVNYEISEDDATFADQATLTAYDGTEKTIYVRLKTGLSAGTYNGENITISGGGTTNISVALSGKVEGITLTSTTTNISGLNYTENNGPSMSQNFSLTGKNLTGDVTITAPEHFEISKDDATFSNSIVLNNFDGSFTKIYVRLKAGYPLGNYSGENITISGGGAASISISLSGKVTTTSFCDDFESDLANWTVTNDPNPNAKVKISNTFSGAESTAKSALFDAPKGNSSTASYYTSSIEKTFTNSKNLSIHFWHYFEDYRGGEIIVYLNDAKKYSIYTEGSGGNLKITESTQKTWAEVTVDLTAETSTAGNYTIKIEGKAKTAKLWKDRVAIDQLCVSDKDIPTGPTLISNPATISNFSYIVSNGPSSSKTFKLTGANLNNSDVTLTSPDNYEISEDNTIFANQIAFVAYDGAEKTIYVRLKAGLSAGTYNDENIAVSGGGATNISVTLSGEVTSKTAIAENNKYFSIYPNPITNGIFNISKSDCENYNVEIYDINGQKIIEKTLNSKQSQIDVTNLKSGIYIAKIIADKKIFVKKLIIRKN